MNNIILTRKIKLGVYVPNTITDETERKQYKDSAWNILRNVNRQNFELHNTLIKKLIQIDSILQSNLDVDLNYIRIRNEYYSDRKNKQNQKQYFDYIKVKRNEYIEQIGYKNLSSFIYNYLIQHLNSYPDEQQFINSYTYCAISKNVVDKYTLDAFDVSKGIKNVAFYKNNQPIPINIKAQPKIDDNGNKIKNLGKEWFGKYDDIYTFKFKSSKKLSLELTLIFGRDKSNNKIIVDRLYNNDPNYKLCDSKIQIIDNEIYLLLSIKYFNTTQSIQLDKNKILGVDLGIKCAAYVATNNSLERKMIGDKQFALMQTKINIEKDKRIAQKNSIFSKSGHGRRRKLQKVFSIKQYEKNFRNTFNHKISSEIIKCAIDWNCGQINVEDLSLIPKELKNNKILRNWAYFDLLTKIEYKAKKYGIEFLKVNPAYTSQKCNICGQIGERIKQDTFICTNNKCVNHDKPINADYNAAINIAKNINKKEIISLDESIF